MYSKISIDEVESLIRTDREPAVQPVGYALRERGDPRPRNMRFNYFIYDEGDTVRRHKQQEQEELYYLVEGRAKMIVGDTEFRIHAGDVVVVDPEPYRQITALERCELFAVGAPNVRDDSVFVQDRANDE